jgi:hypothetical protein
MVTGLARVCGQSSNSEPFKMAIQTERSYMVVVAKQEEFCRGPRQGN